MLLQLIAGEKLVSEMIHHVSSEMYNLTHTRTVTEMERDKRCRDLPASVRCDSVGNLFLTDELMAVIVMT